MAVRGYIAERRSQEEVGMNDEALNMSLRKFLKKVGVTSQREIENAVRAALDDGRLKGHERLKAEVRLTIPQAGLDTVIDGEIELA
jgi:hypothetical protein